VCEPKYEEVAGGWRRLHNEELHNFYDSLIIVVVVIIIMAIKLRRKRWVRHKGCIREMRNAYKILVKGCEGRDHTEDLGVYGRIKTGLILGNRVRKCRLDSYDSG
jgi:hypothetical protein